MQSGQHVRQYTLLKDLECLRKENFDVIEVVCVWGLESDGHCLQS